MVRQADDPFVCFGAKPDKGFWTRDLGWPEVGRERRSESETKELEEGVGEGWREWPVDTGAERPVGWDDVQSSEGRRVKMSRHSSSVVEFSLDTHASVSLHMHNVTLLPFCTWVKPSILFVCSFFYRSLDCISCSGKEMCDAPIGTTSWSPVVKWNGSKRLTYRGIEGVTLHSNKSK